MKEDPLVVYKTTKVHKVESVLSFQGHSEEGFVGSMKVHKRVVLGFVFLISLQGYSLFGFLKRYQVGAHSPLKLITQSSEPTNARKAKEKGLQSQVDVLI